MSITELIARLTTFHAPRHGEMLSYDAVFAYAGGTVETTVPSLKCTAEATNDSYFLDVFSSPRS